MFQATVPSEPAGSDEGFEAADFALQSFNHIFLYFPFVSSSDEFSGNRAVFRRKDVFLL